MRLLLDTHLLLWAKGIPDRLSPVARALLTDPQNILLFSVASIWEIAIKSRVPRNALKVDARVLRRSLLDDDYAELFVTGEHAVTVANLPPIHKDPFDRLLIAQATSEAITLLTADNVVARYPGPVRLV